MTIAKRGTIYNTREWRRLCEAVKRRDGYRCRVCHEPGKEIGGSRTLTCAHRVADRQGGPATMGNLVAICRQCHGRMDGGRRYR